MIQHQTTRFIKHSTSRKDTSSVLLAQSFTTWQRILKGIFELNCGNISLSHFSLSIRSFLNRIIKCNSFLHVYLVLIFFCITSFSKSWALTCFFPLISCEDFEIILSTPHIATTEPALMTSMLESFTSETDANLNETYGYSDTLESTTLIVQFSESGLDFISSMYWKYKNTLYTYNMFFEYTIDILRRDRII